MLSIATLTLVLAALPQEDVQVSFVPATVVAEGAQVRSFHHQEMPLLAELEAGSLVKVVAKREPWARIQVPGGFTVWVWADYVDVEGEQGTLNASHVRARPLPSTSKASYPVGQFAQGDVVWVLAEQEGWLQVRAPESLGAWVQLESLQTLADTPADWDSKWSAATPNFQPEVVEEPVVEESPEVLATSDVVSTEVTEMPMAEVVEVPGDPSLEALSSAEASLTSLAKNWDPQVATQLEAVFGAVLWTSADVEAVKRARFGLERLDAISIRNANPVAASGNLTEVKVAEASTALPTFEKPEYALVGRLEHTPQVYSAVPYSIQTGEQIDSIMSRDGRFDLNDFRGKEVAVRGVWRKSALKKHRVLEITSIRIVPAPVEVKVTEQ